MAKQIVMDATGDTQHQFNPTDVAALKEAERRFQGADRSWLYCGRSYERKPIGIDPKFRSRSRRDCILPPA